MWRAPGLTIAAQAFLLAVLTNEKVDATARAVILVAGVLAVLAAILSLLRLRAREVEYSEAIAYYADAAGIEDPRATEKEKRIPIERRGPFPWIDRGLRWWFSWGQWPILIYWWVAAPIAFIVADVVAFCVTG